MHVEWTWQTEILDFYRACLLYFLVKSARPFVGIPRYTQCLGLSRTHTQRLVGLEAQLEDVTQGCCKQRPPRERVRDATDESHGHNTGL